MARLFQEDNLEDYDILYDSFLLIYEQKVWIKNKMLINKVQSSYKRFFVFNVFGELYFFAPNSETYVYHTKKQEWTRSVPIIDDKILQDLYKLSIIRIL